MGRYIDANALIQDISRSKADNDHNNSIASETHNAEHKKFIKMVLEQPTADVVEVKRGEWVFDDADEYGVTYKCSRCNDLILVRNKHSHKPNYCGNCGADMRSEKNDL